jgi:hypothetical protein
VWRRSDFESPALASLAPSPRVQGLTSTRASPAPSPRFQRPFGVAICTSTLACDRPSLGLSTLRRPQSCAATYAGTSNPGCAASSGFLNPSTRCSAHDLAALFHAAAALGFPVYGVFPHPLAGVSLDRLSSLPLLRAAPDALPAEADPLFRCVHVTRLRGCQHLDGPLPCLRCYSPST